jgi:hypothetical protein
MNYVNRILAVVSVLLFYCVLIYVDLRVGPIPIPSNHYTQEYPVLAQTVIDALTDVLPVFVLTFAWSWITLRWLARPARIAAWWYLGALFVGFVCTQVFFDIRQYYQCVDLERQYHWHQACDSIPASIYRSLVHEWAPFGLLLAGFALAAGMVLRSERITVRQAHA